MRVATCAAYFGAAHAVGSVAMFVDVGGGPSLVEAGPATAGVELVVRLEQRRAAAYTAIGAGGFEIVIFAGERAFGAGLARDLIGLGRELRTPFGLGLLYFTVVAHTTPVCPELKF